MLLRIFFENNKLLVGGNEMNSNRKKAWTREPFCKQADNGWWVCGYFIEDQCHHPPIGLFENNVPRGTFAHQ